MMKKGFVAASTSSQRCRCLLFHIRRDGLHPPMIIVKASEHSQGMINGTVGSGLFHRMSRKNLERTRRQLQPQHKLCQIIEGHMLPVKPLLGDEFPIQPKCESIGS